MLSQSKKLSPTIYLLIRARPSIKEIIPMQNRCFSKTTEPNNEEMMKKKKIRKIKKQN